MLPARISLAIITGLMGIAEMGSDAAEPQPGITSIAATVAQLGEGWTSNRVMVLIDPLSSPREIADPNENPEGLLKMAQDLLRREPQREAYAMLRYYGGGAGMHQTNTLVYISRWKSKDDLKGAWARDKETKDSSATLPKVGEEIRFSQRDGLHNNITFRRGNYLVAVECSKSYGVEHLKKLAEVLDGNLLKAQPLMPVLKVDDAHYVSDPENVHPERYRIGPSSGIVLDATGYAFKPSLGVPEKPVVSVEITQHLTGKEGAAKRRYQLGVAPGKTRHELSGTTLEPLPGSPPFTGFSAGERWFVFILIGTPTETNKFFAGWSGVIEVE